MSESIELHSNGIRFHAHSKGSEGPLVVLLHGFPELGISWSAQIEALAARGFRVLAPDLRGFGKTERPSKVSSYDLDNLSEDVLGLIKAMGEERAHIVGHDWGGGLSWHLAQRNPEAVDRLAILNCPHPGVLLGSLGSFRQLRRSWYMFFFQLPWIPEWTLGPNSRVAITRVFHDASANPGLFSPERLEPYVEAMASRGWRGGLNWYRAAFRGVFSGGRARRELWQRPIQAPTLIIWGTSDPVLGEELIDPSTALLTDSRVERIPSAGHWVQQEAPEQVNSLLGDFLSAGDSAGQADGITPAR
jgi:pimeloyl-ACP methyl ester carboxylesterase